MNVCELLEETTTANPARAALIGGIRASRRVESFASLRRRAEAVALQFRARGLRPRRPGPAGRTDVDRNHHRHAGYSAGRPGGDIH